MKAVGNFIVVISFIFLVGNPVNGFAALSSNDSLLVRNFVVKSYIVLLGNKPDKQTIEASCKNFDLYRSFEKGNKQFIDSLLSNRTFFTNLFDRYRYEYLQGANNELIYKEVSDYTLLLTIKTQSDFFDMFSSILSKLQRLLTVEEKMATGKMSFDEALVCFIDNKLYDDNNMGPDNFIISTFSYLFFRNPTRYELKQGKAMVENQPGVLFSKQGQTKADYLQILVASDAYKEGRVRYWYNSILNREPTTDEITDFMMQDGFNTRKLIKGIICSKEFAGF